MTSSTKRLPPRTMDCLADPRQHRYRGAIPKILVEPAKPLGQFLLLKRGWRVAIGLHPLFRRDIEFPDALRCRDSDEPKISLS